MRIFVTISTPNIARATSRAATPFDFWFAITWFCNLKCKKRDWKNLLIKLPLTIYSTYVVVCILNLMIYTITAVYSLSPVLAEFSAIITSTFKISFTMRISVTIPTSYRTRFLLWAATPICENASCWRKPITSLSRGLSRWWRGCCWG